MPRSALALTVVLCLAVAAGGDSQANSLSLPDTSGESGQVLTIPLQGSFQSQVSGVTFSLLFDPNVLQINSVSVAGAFGGFSIQTNLTSGRLRVAMAGAIPVVGDGAVLVLDVVLIGPPGTTSKLDLSSAVLNEGDADIAVQDGLVTIVRLAEIGGAVLYRTASRPVSGAVVEAMDLGDGAVTQATTDALGAYTLGPLPPGEYLLAAARSGVEDGAIDVLDVSDILRHLVGLLELSADDEFAADVSGNGRVGTTDASRILRYLVGLEYEFPAGDFWQFEPDEVPVNLLQDETRDFTAYLLGDVNGDWEVTPPPGKPVAATGPSLHFGPAEPVEPALTRFPLTAVDLVALRGGELRLVYNPQDLEAAAVWTTDHTDGFMLAANLAEPGLVRVAFAGAHEIDGDGALLLVDFRELGATGTATPLTIEAASLNGAALGTDALDHTLYILGSAHGDVPTAVAGDPAARPGDPTLAAAYPNPFNAATVLEYRLDAATRVELTVYGADGRRVRRLIDGVRTAGSHRVTWDGRDDRGAPVASGAYFAHLGIGRTGITRSLMLLR